VRAADLERLAGRVVSCAAVGAGQTVKACNQLIVTARRVQAQTRLAPGRTGAAARQGHARAHARAGTMLARPGIAPYADGGLMAVV
jgi:hypothetical protein